MRQDRPTEQARAEKTGRDFAMQEHLAMLAKLDRAGEDIYRTETVVPLAIAAFYAWMLSRTNCAGMPWWLYLVPPILSSLGFARYSARVQYIRQAEKYVRKLERRLRGVYSGTRGWERFYKNKLTWYWTVRTAFWISLTLASASIALVYYRAPDLLCGQALAVQPDQSLPVPLAL